MMEPNNIESRLWDYIDGTCSEPEKLAVEKLLQTDPIWQGRYRELIEVQKLLQSQELDAPSMRFSKNVMETIASHQISKATVNYINKKIIFGISAFFFLVISGMLILYFASADWSGSSTISNQINKWNPSQYISKQVVQIIMFVNVILGLFLLDRYLARRKTNRHQEA